MAGDGCFDSQTAQHTHPLAPHTAVRAYAEPEAAPSTPAHRLDAAVETAVVRAIFGGNELARRRFLQLVGASTAMAIIGSVFPLDTAKALAQEQVKGIEKKDLTVSFIPITCATPIIMAEPMGFYARHGLNVTVRRAAGWAVVRDWAINKEVDATHMLSPMPCLSPWEQVRRRYPTSCLPWKTLMGRRSRCTTSIKACRGRRT
jgi:NMT1-like family